MISLQKVQQTPSLPLVNHKWYTASVALNKNPAEAGMLLSSIQSHRSLVFARREERFPQVEKRQQTVAVNRNQPTSRHAEPLRNVSVKRINTNRQNHLFSAPQPAGKTTNHLPTVIRNTKGDSRDLDGRSSTRTNHTSRVKPTQVAGISSKEHEVQILRNEKLASGWAEARAGHAIPNLRDSSEDNKSPREKSKDHSSAARSKTDKDTVDGKLPMTKQSEKRGSRQSLNKKHTDDNESAVSNKSTAKKLQKLPTATGRTNVKSKGSSGYGSMSSNSLPENQANHKHSVFKLPSHYESVTGSEKTRELASVYGSKVVVKSNSQNVGVHLSEQEQILSEREADMYVHLKTTYKQAAEQERERRKDKFFKKLQDIQIDSALQHNQQLKEKAVRKEQAKRRQIEQLEHIRSKFEEQRQRRYKSQYVTKNFLDYERMDRGEYGLPENYTTKTEYQAKIKRTGGGKVTARDFIKREVKLKKTYSKMFAAKPASGVTNTSDPKMEGRDRMTLEVHDAQGNPVKSKKVDVKTEIQEAQDMLKDMETGESDSLLAANEKAVAKVTTAPAKKPVDSVKVKPSSTSPKKTKPAFKPQATSITKSQAPAAAINKAKPANPKIVVEDSAPVLTAPTLSPQPTASTNNHLLDRASIQSRISVITEESEGGEDFYDKLMAKYGIELSDDEDDY